MQESIKKKSSNSTMLSTNLQTGPEALSLDKFFSAFMPKHPLVSLLA